uniref:Uncharacterized protein n=1 Tax=Rhizochromulina marina TaxID=1034831 RepID=A0A7S2WRP4_9STRA
MEGVKVGVVGAAGGEATETCSFGYGSLPALTQPLGIVVIAILVISAVSMGALVALLVYVRRVMYRANKILNKLESMATREDVAQLRAMAKRDNGYLDTMSTGYSSGEDFGEEHLTTARRSIQRSLSNSSIQSLRQSLTHPGLRDSITANDLVSLDYMFGDEAGGVSC